MTVNQSRALSKEADRLLVAAGATERKTVLTEASIEQNARRRREKDRSYSMSSGGLDPADTAMGVALVLSDVEDVLLRSKLTENQFFVLKAKIIEKLTFKEIGEARGTTKQGAMNVFVQGIRKVKDHFDKGEYDGLMECYWADVRRNGMRKRMNLSMASKTQ